MPKHNPPGGRRKRRRRRSKLNRERKVLLLKQTGQEYARVIALLGNGKYMAFGHDGKVRECRIRTKIKRLWLNVNDMVLISLRQFQDEKADIIYKYKPDEIFEIKRIMEISVARPLVFGYIRMQQKSLPFEVNSFYTIPDLVAHKCLEIYISLFFCFDKR